MKPASGKWMWTSLLLTLVVGTGMGVALDRLVLDQDGSDGQRRPRGAGLAARLNEELGLTPDQQAKVEAALASNRERARKFWSESEAAFENLRQEFRQDIRALLNPEQQARFDEMVQRDDERRRQREDRR